MTRPATTTKTPAKRPPSAATATRSGAKGARKPAKAKAVPGKGYPEEVRAKALATVEASGIAAAHAEHGIPKPTLTRWAKAAGIDVDEQARARTKAATEAVRARAAEVKLGTVALLEHHLEQAGSYLGTIAGVNALAAQRIAALDPSLIRVEQGLAGPYAVVEDADAQAAAKVALALDGLPLAVRDAEGIVTRAIHDLALLNGEATERGELVVNFGGIPRPDPAATDAGVIEVDVEDEGALGIEARA